MSDHSRSLGSFDRKLRYRALLDDLSTLDIESASNDERMSKTSEAVQEAQSLLEDGGVEERVKHPGEGYLDSRVVRATSDIAMRCSEAVSGNANVYDKHDLAAHIRDNGHFWDLSPPLRAPVSTTLHGTFTAQPRVVKERAQPKQRARDRVAELKQPDDMTQIEKTEEGSEMVSRVNRFITKQYRNSSEVPLDYFRTVVDPSSYSRSIENVYYVSFLVRDRLADVSIDESTGLPVIRPVPAEEREQSERDISDENQFIVSLDMKRWKELIDVFKITKPMMVLKRL